VPIVSAAAIFDLTVGSATARPTADDGYRACHAAKGGAVAQGSVGAGTGAAAGHVLGAGQATKSGLGTASQKIVNDIVVGALIVVNPLGDIVAPRTGDILAGARKPVGGGWLDSGEAIKSGIAQTIMPRTHTTIGVVATNAALTKEEANLVAMMAHDGYARAIRPAHATFDGDALFVLSAGKKQGDVTAIGHTASEVVAQAIVNAVNAAESLCGIPARKDLK
jgi:L-aminopeptidase/D-esterase-like protein